MSEQKTLDQKKAEFDAYLAKLNEARSATFVEIIMLMVRAKMIAQSSAGHLANKIENAANSDSVLDCFFEAVARLIEAEGSPVDDFTEVVDAILAIGA